MRLNRWPAPGPEQKPDEWALDEIGRVPRYRAVRQIHREAQRLNARQQMEQGKQAAWTTVWQAHPSTPCWQHSLPQPSLEHDGPRLPGSSTCSPQDWHGFALRNGHTQPGKSPTASNMQIAARDRMLVESCAIKRGVPPQ